jgi:hypothetical protein
MQLMLLLHGTPCECRSSCISIRQTRTVLLGLHLHNKGFALYPYLLLLLLVMVVRLL